MAHILHYDDARMRISAADRKTLRASLREADASLERVRASGSQGFLGLPYDRVAVKSALTTARIAQRRFTRMVVIGIGGSDLGARALWQALGGSKTRLDFISGPDPETIFRMTRNTDWSHTAVNVVSKSGGTIETLATFMAVREALVGAVGHAEHAAHVFVTTEPSPSSVLFQIARAEGYAVIEHPANVGGRFSVLSTVGLFPAAFGDIDVRALLAGAREAEEERRANGPKSVAARFAANQYLSLARYGRHIHVLMPYSDALAGVGLWYRQLWAESLGKRRGATGVGPTPIAASGPTDQHSQIQLYTQGPDDKTVTFVETRTFRRAGSVPRIWKSIPAARSIGGIPFSKLMHASRAGTEHALSKAGKPNGTIYLPSVSPTTVGALLMTLEAAVVYAAELMRVNAFDQPGVEEGKRKTRELLR